LFGVHALVTGRKTRMKPDVDALTSRVAARTGWGGSGGSSAELKRLDDMHRKGHLTDDEYEASKLAAQRKEQLT
jgi:hypothetical protein